MPLNRCLRRLSYLWAGGAAIVFSVSFIQFLLDHYPSGPAGAGALSMLLSLVLPTTGLIVSSWWTATSSVQSNKRLIDSRFFGLTWWLSLLYLILLLGAILFQPLVTTNMTDYIGKVHLAMSIFQTVIAAALGAFFIGKSEPAKA